MIKELDLRNFRGFRQFKLGDLRRVNLVVGANSSGKTSCLEALELLHAHGDPVATSKAISRREERMAGEKERDAGMDVDVSHLFYGYDPSFDSTFCIVGKFGDGRVVQAEASLAGASFASDSSRKEGGKWALSDAPYEFRLHWKDGGRQVAEVMLPVTEDYEFFSDRSSLRTQRQIEGRGPFVFVATDSLLKDEVIALLSTIILEPEESLMLRALRFINSDIERIAPVVGRRRLRSGHSFQSGGIMVKTKKLERRIPIGDMGDGIWRLLSLVLSLVQARGGVLVVDEIDTGLHYSVMEDMWRLLLATAKQLDIQVFATTHSSDCWKALAAVSSSEGHADEDISIQRIESGRLESVAFFGGQIGIAAEQGIEIR